MTCNLTYDDATEEERNQVIEMTCQIYRNLPELIDAYTNWLEEQTLPVYVGEPELQEFRRLFKVYWDAQKDPPPGIIGVGIITYAEMKLREAQYDNL